MITTNLLEDYNNGVPLDRLSEHYKLPQREIIILVHADITKDLGLVPVPQSNSEAPRSNEVPI